MFDRVESFDSFQQSKHAHEVMRPSHVPSGVLLTGHANGCTRKVGRGDCKGSIMEITLLFTDVCTVRVVCK